MPIYFAQTFRMPSRQFIGDPDNSPVLSPLFWLVAVNRRRPRGVLTKHYSLSTFTPKRETSKNCPLSLPGVLYLSPHYRRFSRAKSKRTLMRASVWQSVRVALSVRLPHRRRRSSLLWGSSLGRRLLRPSWGCGTHHPPRGPKDSTRSSRAVGLAPWEPSAIPGTVLDHRC